MNSIETEEAIRNLELMLGTPTQFHSGACTRDIRTVPSDNIPFREQKREEPDFVVEVYKIYPDGHMRVLSPRMWIRCYRHIPEGYDFQI